MFVKTLCPDRWYLQRERSKSMSVASRKSDHLSVLLLWLNMRKEAVLAIKSAEKTRAAFEVGLLFETWKSDVSIKEVLINWRDLCAFHLLSCTICITVEKNQSPPDLIMCLYMVLIIQNGNTKLKNHMPYSWGDINTHKFCENPSNYLCIYMNWNKKMFQ